MRYLTLSLMGLMVINGASAAVDCKPVVSSPNGKSTLKFDLTPLAGLHEASKETSTPPTTQEARVQLNVCGDDSIPYNDDLAEEDQVRLTRARSSKGQLQRRSCLFCTVSIRHKALSDLVESQAFLQ